MGHHGSKQISTHDLAMYHKKTVLPSYTEAWKLVHMDPLEEWENALAEQCGFNSSVMYSCTCGENSQVGGFNYCGGKNCSTLSKPVQHNKSGFIFYRYKNTDTHVPFPKPLKKLRKLHIDEVIVLACCKTKILLMVTGNCKQTNKKTHANITNNSEESFLLLVDTLSKTLKKLEFGKTTIHLAVCVRAAFSSDGSVLATLNLTWFDDKDLNATVLLQELRVYSCADGSQLMAITFKTNVENLSPFLCSHGIDLCFTACNEQLVLLNINADDVPSCFDPIPILSHFSLKECKTTKTCDLRDLMETYGEKLDLPHSITMSQDGVFLFMCSKGLDLQEIGIEGDVQFIHILEAGSLEHLYCLPHPKHSFFAPKVSLCATRFCVQVEREDSSGEILQAVEVYQLPVKVLNLKHLCRVVILQAVNTTFISKLSLPTKLKDYLEFKS